MACNCHNSGLNDMYIGEMPRPAGSNPLFKSSKFNSEIDYSSLALIGGTSLLAGVLLDRFVFPKKKK